MRPWGSSWNEWYARFPEDREGRHFMFQFQFSVVPCKCLGWKSPAANHSKILKGLCVNVCGDLL